MIHSKTIKIDDYSWDDAYIVMDDAIWNRLQKYARFAPGRSKSVIIAETVLTLTWTMLFEIVCKVERMTHFRTIDIYDYSWDGVTLSWKLQFETVCKLTHFPLLHHQTLWLQLRRCLHSHGRCYLKSLANVRITHSRTMQIYDYSWNGAYIVMDDAIWNRLRTYAWSTPGPSKSMIIAETVLTLSRTMLF